MKARRRTSSTTRTTPTRMATPCRTGMSISSAATRTTRDVYSFGNAPLLIQLASDAGDGVEATYEIVSGPTLGTLSGDGQSLTYQRTAAGDDSLTFVTHRGGATSLPTTITIHNDPPFAISVAPEIAGLGLTLQGYSAGALVDVPLVSLGGEGSGNVRFAVELTGLDPGAPLKLVGELDRLKLREKTIVLFTGDNGTAHFGPAIVDARRISGKKASMLEGGSRVPLIVNCPGTTRAAAVNHDLIDFSDFFSTFAQLGGATLPAGVTLDSRSFAQQIKGEKGTPREWVMS